MFYTARLGGDAADITVEPHQGRRGDGNAAVKVKPPWVLDDTRAFGASWSARVRKAALWHAGGGRALFSRAPGAHFRYPPALS